MHSKALLVSSLVSLAASATTNTNLQTTFPAASGTTNLAAVKTIAAGQSFDGGMKQWDRSRESSFFSKINVDDGHEHYTQRLLDLPSNQLTPYSKHM